MRQNGWPLQLIESSALRYAELFFHVFAHVAGTRCLPSSVFSSRYVDWARARLGEPASRTLAEDARLLADAFPTHQALAGIQPLARLFASPARLSSVGSASLSELRPEQVDDAGVLSHVQRLGAAAELYRQRRHRRSLRSLHADPPVSEGYCKRHDQANKSLGRHVQPRE